MNNSWSLIVVIPVVYILNTTHHSKYIPLHIDINLGGRRGVWFRVLCGELHTHNTFRVADSLLLCMGNQYYYVDRA